MPDLRGKAAIVTGASRGIGRAISLRLAAAGARVVAGARADHAEPVAREIETAGGTAIAVSLDVTQTASITAMAQAALERFGRIDVLVNNAGIVRDQLLLRMKPEEWDAVISTNLTAAFACCRTVLRPMVKQRSGRIVNIGSVVGPDGEPRPGQLRGVEGRSGRVHPIAGPGGRVTGHHRERRGAGNDRDGYDRRARRARAGSARRSYSDGPARNGG